MAGKSSQLSREDQERFNKIFTELDTDRNGWLSREEIGVWLRGAGFSLSDHKIESIFRVIDENADGKISLDEFYKFMHHMRNPPNGSTDLRRVFGAMDTNGDGFLSETELFDGLNKCGYNLTRQQVKKFIVNLDQNNDGQISFDEFLGAFKNN